jgi:cyclase
MPYRLPSRVACITRRGVLLALPAVYCLLSAACTSRARDVNEPAFTLEQVGPQVWAAIDNPKATARAFSNAGFVIGDDGVAVVDTFENDEAASQLLAEIRRLTTLPVKFVINTHYHLDHVGGNRVFVDAGAAVLAQRNVRDWIHPENLRLVGTDITAAQEAAIRAYVAPTVLYEQSVDLYLGSRRIQVRSLPGHTGGDSVVLIADAKAAFAGDLFWRNMLPNTIDASTKPWIDTLDALARDHSGYAFVPGHGDVGNAQDVAASRDYLATLQTLVVAAQRQGTSGSALVAAVVPALTDKYGHWDFFQIAERNILEADAELRGWKRIPLAASTSR